MDAVGGEALVWAVALAALILLPLASWLVASVGKEISAELDGGRTGSDLRRHLDRTYARAAGSDERALRDSEIRQLVEGRSFLRRGHGEEPLDVDAEVARIEAEIARSERDVSA